MALGEAPSSVAGVIDDRPWAWRQKLLLALVSLTILLDGFDNQSLGFALPSLMRDWRLPKAALGSALAAAQVGMLIGAISGGVVGDRFGRKAALVASTTLFGAGTLLIGFVHTPLQLASLRFAAGLGLGRLSPLLPRWPQNLRRHATAAWRSSSRSSACRWAAWLAAWRHRRSCP